MQTQIEKVYLLYYQDLYRFLRSLHAPDDLIDDLIQNTFIEAMKGFERLQKKSSVKPWLFTIAKFEWYRYLRKNKKFAHYDVTDAEQIADHHKMDDQILSNLVMEHIDTLNPPLHEIMLYRLSYGMSFKEIGQKINRTENYCRVNFYRARQQLRKEFGDEKL